jgi:DNA-binding MarR family transcriptional regulator
MIFERDESLGYLANHMARLLAQGLHERIKPLGLAPAQFTALVELWRGDGITQRQLTERLDFDQSTIAKTLVRMERDGLIRREAHASDRRAQVLKLTDKARKLLRPAMEAAKAQNDDALEKLSEKDQLRLLAMMRVIIDTLRDRKG